MAQLSEVQKMLSGELYNAGDYDLVQMRLKCKLLCHKLNSQTASVCEKFGQREIPEKFEPQLMYQSVVERQRIIRLLFGGIGDKCVIESPFLCDYASFPTFILTLLGQKYCIRRQSVYGMIFFQ